MSILLIEPDKLSARLLVAQLAADGLSVERAVSGQQAIHVLESSPISCIVIEPQLGVHNGIEFLYELRSYSEWQDIPVIVWTMNRTLLDSRFAKSWKELGVVAVRYKPDEPLAGLANLIGNSLAVAA